MFSLDALIAVETSIIKKSKITKTFVEKVKEFLFENLEYENALALRLILTLSK